MVLVDTTTKHQSSGQGQATAHTSPLQAARLEATKEQMEAMTKALQSGDLKTVLELTEKNSLMLHSVRLTQTPSHHYFTHKTWQLIERLRETDAKDWTWTLDAGANPHIITTEEAAPNIQKLLDEWAYPYLTNKPGAGLTVINQNV